MLFLCKSLKFILFFSDKVEEENSKSAAETEVSTGMTLEFARLSFNGMNHHNTLLLLLRYAQYCDICYDSFFLYKSYESQFCCADTSDWTVST